MAKSAKKSKIDREMEYAGPFGTFLSNEMNRVINEAPRKDRGLALYAMSRVLMHIWINTMRNMGSGPIQGIMTIIEAWGHIAEMDEEEKEAMGGLH